MKTRTLVLRHWEDVVFENRNKAYGAYALRRAYSKRVIVGWGITIALFAALLYLPDLLWPQTAKIVDPFVTVTIDGLQPPPVIEPIKKQQPQQRPKPSTARSTQILVTRDPVETTVEPIQDFATPVDDVGTGVIESFDDGNAVAVEEPVAVKPEPIRDFAEVMPEFVGGYAEMMRFIQRNTRYPASARRIGINGTVFVRFVVDPSGNISGVEVIRGISADCDKEAARVISSMPKWTAATQNGVNVPVRMVVPIRFQLN